ncbi:alpha-amylase family glycosyl hydrolase [Nostocoides veronense]
MPGQRSLHGGMGAIPHDGGVTFRVWAPNARNVAVIGDFCGWERRRMTPMARDHSRAGTWSAFVPAARTGSEYRFLVRRGGPYLWRIDPVARQVTHSRGNAIVFDPRAVDWGSEPFEMPAWDDVVIYEVHIPTFAAGGPHGRTFEAAAARLDHLAWLGVNAVEIMPCAEFAGDTSWGYNPAHPFAVESSYGGPRGLTHFVREAHRRGIAVILDVVHNHLGPSDLDLWRFDGWHRSHYGGIYFYNDQRARTPWGATRPNYHRKDVRNYLRDSAVMWLEDFRVDGLRFDATNYIRARWGDVRDPAQRLGAGHRYLASLTSDLRSRQPWKLLIAEDMQSDPLVTADVADGGLGFHGQWDAHFVRTVRGALEALRDEDRDVGGVAAAIAAAGLGEVHQRVIFTESHDEVANGRTRLPESIAPGAADSLPARQRAALGLVLTLTSPGIPLLFQGQDILEDRWFEDTRPVDWGKAHRHSGFLHLTRALIALRRNLPGVTAGLRGRGTRVLRVDPARGIIVVHRWHQGGPRDDTVVVVNLSARPVHGYAVGLPRAGQWTLRLNTDAPCFGPGLGAVHARDVQAQEGWCDGLPYRAEVSIGPYAALVYSQDA